ncbi:MAG TPA: thiosulfate sulfurtransferase GlpE [bacterium]|nr:thiosulfate sulfurtransferase GlpE [bacterium]
MHDVKEIGLDEAQERLKAGQTFLDVRDEGSFQAGHVPGAVFLDDRSVGDFMAKADKKAPVVVYCYRGHTSLGAAAYLMDNGFTDVMSLTGGFEAWRPTGKIES